MSFVSRERERERERERIIGGVVVLVIIIITVPISPKRMYITHAKPLSACKSTIDELINCTDKLLFPFLFVF